MTRRLTCVLIGMLLLASACGAQPQPYLLRLADEAARWRAQLGAMEASAQRAAEGAIVGGTVYAFGPQPGFVAEASGRAGGLVLLQPYRTDTALTARDTILAAVAHASDDGALTAVIDAAQRAGAQVVVFGHANLDGAAALSAGERDERAVSIESMSNVVGMWSWTGRFIAACVDHGRMPCVYQSYLLPGGRERGAYLSGHERGRFHAVTAVQPADAERIAQAFLDAVESSLRRTWTENGRSFDRAAALLRDVRGAGGTVGVYTMGHLFPEEFDQPQQPAWIKAADAKNAGAQRHAAAVVLTYQATPWELLAHLTADDGAADRPVIWTCAQPAAAELTVQPHHVYLDPHWPLSDGVVELAGYDVPLLPASGVMDAAVYWQLIEMTANEETP